MTTSKPAVQVPAGAPPADLEIVGGVIKPGEMLVFVVDLLGVG